MLLVGLLLSFVFSFYELSPGLTGFFRALGLSFVVSALVLLYQEIMNITVGTADEKRFQEVLSRLHHPDLRKIVSRRKDYSRYHEWAGIKEKTDIFFAGHSVLHKIKADFESLPVGSVPDAIIRKLEDGSTIKILLLDPSWDYVDEIVMAQDQRADDFYRDLQVTFQVVRDIAKALEEHDSVRGELEIKMCRSNLQYSYHRIKYLQSGDVDMLVGFYFAGIEGTYSPLFRAETEEIQRFFDAHFEKLFRAERSTQDLLIHTRHRRQFCEQAHAKCVTYLEEKVRTLGGEPKSETSDEQPDSSG